MWLRQSSKMCATCMNFTVHLASRCVVCTSLHHTIANVVRTFIRVDWILKSDTHTHTNIQMLDEIRCMICCLALRHLAIIRFRRFLCDLEDRGTLCRILSAVMVLWSTKGFKIAWKPTKQLLDHRCCAVVTMDMKGYIRDNKPM